MISMEKNGVRRNNGQEQSGKTGAKWLEIKVCLFAVIVLVLLVLCYYDNDVGYTGKNKRLICEGYDPVISPDGTKILYTDSNDGQGSHYFINIDGTNKKMLTENRMSDPSISLDNNEILYHGCLVDPYADYRGCYNAEIRIMDIKATNDYYVANGYHSSLSSNGEKVLFAHMAANVTDGPFKWNNTLRIVDKDGTNETIVMRTFFPYHILHPMFCHDGQKILFCIDNTTRPVERRYDIYRYEKHNNFTTGVWTINIDGSDPQHLAEEGAAIVSSWTQAKISRNMKKIVRYGNTHYHRMSLWTMDADGTNEVKLPGYYFGPVDISIDGKKVAWTGVDIWILNSDGTGEERLAKGYGPQFCPVGKKIIYTDDGNIYSIEYD